MSVYIWRCSFVRSQTCLYGISLQFNYINLSYLCDVSVVTVRDAYKTYVCQDDIKCLRYHCLGVEIVLFRTYTSSHFLKVKDKIPHKFNGTEMICVGCYELVLRQPVNMALTRNKKIHGCTNG